MSALVQAPLRQSPSAVSGMVAMSIAMLLLPLGDAVAKLLTSLLAPAQIAAMRAMIQASILGGAYMIWQHRMSGVPFTIWSFLSGQLVAVVSLSLITAFQTMPIATAIAIFFIEPLLLTLLAGIVLGEKPGRHRYAAIGIGLLGVLLILRPNFAVFGPTVFLPVAGAIAYALNMIIMRRATRSTSALTFQLGSATFASATLGIIMLVSSDMAELATAFSPAILLGLVGLGAVATMTFLLIAFALSRTEASLLAPFQYLEILGAALLGFLIFRDMPDGLTVLGTCIILVSGMYVFYRERRANMPVRKTQILRDR